MYLSTDQLAAANEAIRETFEHTSIAWQVIPHWDTGDPGQVMVRDDILNAPGFLALAHKDVPFQLTLVQTSAPTFDSLLTEVIKATADLAQIVDNLVLQQLFDSTKVVGANTVIKVVPTDLAPQLLPKLITARAEVEDAGFRAPSCVIVNTAALVALSDVSTGTSLLEAVLASANINALNRATTINAALPNVTPPEQILLVLGRRQRIAQGGAPQASPGEEPVDLAVSVMPSLEVRGETTNSCIELAVRIGFALRIKDLKGIVGLYN